MKSIAILACVLFAVGLVSAQTPSSPPPKGVSPSGGFTGKVTEAMNAGDYTYVQVETGTNKIWAAAPRFPVKAGDQVAITAGMPMQHYHSKILNRDFDVVYFTDRVRVGGDKTDAQGGIPELPKNHPPIPGLTAPPSMDLSGIKKAQGGETVAEICAHKEQLKGKTVKVRGKVVKYNPHIMGRNWLHLRDGSGSEGSNDLLVTTDDEVKLGDIVLATGVVAVNQDFGANYKYPVMLEHAKVTVE